MSLCCPVVQTGLADSEHNFTPIKCPLRPASYRPHAVIELSVSSISATAIQYFLHSPVEIEIFSSLPPSSH